MSEQHDNPFSKRVGRDPLELPPELLLKQELGYIDARFGTVVNSAAIISEALNLPRTAFVSSYGELLTNPGIVLTHPRSTQVNYASYLAKTRRFDSFGSPITQQNIHNATMELGFVVPETGQIVLERWPEEYDRAAVENPHKTHYIWRLGRLLGERLIPAYHSNRLTINDVLSVTGVADSDITTLLLEQLKLPSHVDPNDAWESLYEMIFNNRNPTEYYYQIQFRGKIATLIQRDKSNGKESRFCNEIYNPESYIIQELIKESYATLIDFLHYIIELNQDIGENPSDPEFRLFLANTLKLTQESEIFLKAYLEKRTPEWSTAFDHRFRIRLVRAIIGSGGFESFIKELIEYETPHSKPKYFLELGSPKYRHLKNTVKSYFAYRSIRAMLYCFRSYPDFYADIVEDIAYGRHKDFVQKVMRLVNGSDDPERVNNTLSSLFSAYPYPAETFRRFLAEDNSGRSLSVPVIIRKAVDAMEDADTRKLLSWGLGV